jgi:hypothetical protein
MAIIGAALLLAHGWHKAVELAMAKQHPSASNKAEKADFVAFMRQL